MLSSQEVCYPKMQVWTCPDKASVSEVFMYAITAANVQVPCPSSQQWCPCSSLCFLRMTLDELYLCKAGIT